MKKFLTLLAVAAMFGFISCKEKEPEPVVNPTTATITANDVTVEVGKTVSIGATTNSSAAITYTCDNTAVATVTASGEVAGVAAGSANITLKVAAVEGKFTAAEKAIKVTVTAPDVPPTPQNKGITIDGDFADWSELEEGTFAKAVCDPNAPWESVQEIRCYAADDMVYYYIKFDEESLAEVADWATKEAHLRLCINTDDEYESGYANYFLEAYDFIVEGCFIADGAFTEFDGTLHQRIGSWKELLAPGNELVYGVGNGTEYEISLNRSIFNDAANTSTAPMPMGDHFQTGIRFYCNGWEEWSNMPNCDVDEEAGNGYGYLLRVTFNDLPE